MRTRFCSTFTGVLYFDLLLPAIAEGTGTAMLVLRQAFASIDCSVCFAVLSDLFRFYSTITVASFG